MLLRELPGIICAHDLPGAAATHSFNGMASGRILPCGSVRCERQVALQAHVGGGPSDRCIVTFTAAPIIPGSEHTHSGAVLAVATAGSACPRPAACTCCCHIGVSSCQKRVDLQLGLGVATSCSAQVKTVRERSILESA